MTTLPAHPDRILIAEDDAEIRTALERILGYEGYETRSVGDGAAALAAVREEKPDAILLDVMMPFVSGVAVCRRIREDGDDTPVLMLTARHGIGERVEGLDAGADDYVTKPFDLQELLARIRALLRRGGGPIGEVLSLGALRMDVRSRQVVVEDADVHLTRTEFAILEVLMRNAGIVLEKSTLYDRVWGYDFGDTSRSLDVHIGYLRRKIERGGSPRVIQTVRGVGYVLRHQSAEA